MTAERIEDLITHIHKQLPNYDTEPVQRAYDTAAHAHRNQRRKSGEPYVTHVVAAADILAELRMDPPVIIAGLLHDTVEDTDLTLDSIKESFGDEVAGLVEGVTRLGKISEVTGSRRRALGHMETESLRKMFLAMSRDVRVVLVKLADRLHNMRTLHALSREKQLSIARETQEIFAPLANRLGIWQIKWELEDLCLRYLEPATYYDLVVRLNERREEREQFVIDASEKVRKALEDMGIKAEISGRSKHLYSIYKKMKRKEHDLDQIFDVRALRVIVQSKAECYAALGIVHGIWRPVPGEFDDYIANPKGNNYQSLHTAVYADKGKALEIQIRDRDMHHYAEYGVAAHWRYKESSKSDAYLDQQVRMFRQMMGEITSGNDADDFVEEVRSDVLPEHIFVFTPKGDIRELPAGATPIDFAYNIHTNIGDRCTGAKVNGSQVSLNTTLHYGDRIEILTGNRGGPSLDWLNEDLGYVTTTRAKSKIRQYFRKLGRDENIRQGRESLERELRRMGIRLSKVNLEKLSRDNKYEKLDDFFAHVGSGDLSAHSIAARELELRQAEEAAKAKPTNTGVANEIASYTGKAPSKKVGTTTISMGGVDGLMTRIARCCNPVLGDDIVGYVTVGKGISVHRRDCTQMLKAHPDRMVEVNWGNREEAVFTVPIKVLAFDRDGLLHDITEVVSNEKVNLGTVTATTDKVSNSAVVTAQLEVKDAAQLARILARIAKLPNVYEVYRASGG